MNNSNQIIEEFKGGMGAVAGGDSFGSGAFGGSRGSSSRSPSSTSQGGSKKYGSSGYASVSPITGSMSGLANTIVKPGAKTGTYTGGSFGGDGRYVVGFPGIKPGSNLPASSEPSLYMKPKPLDVKPRFFNGQTLQDVTLPYGMPEKHITSGIPGPIIGNKYDNVNYNRATKLRGPKFPYGVNLRDKNLTGYYGYQGQGYWLNPWYWGLGPFYPITGQILDYPDPPYNYEDLMQKEINADNMVNTIQNQLANQYMEEEMKKEENESKENENKENENIDITDSKSKPNSKENFESGEQSCNRNNILIILAVVLIIYILLTITMSNTEKKFSL